MEDEFADLLGGIIEGRNQFFSRTINLIRPPSRDAIMSRFMINEMCLLELTNRIHQQSIQTARAAASLVMTLPLTNFFDPVPVSASTAQISAGTEALENAPADTQCAICQDAVTTDATRIRSCGHTYHRGCLSNWLTMSVRCPVCRHDIRSAHPPAQTSPASAETSPPSTTQ